MNTESQESNTVCPSRIRETMRLLEREFGPVRYRRRLDPVAELVGTILSQNTSDVNSHRAFRSLRQVFGNWEEVMEGDVRQVAESIRHGGLAEVKAPRIQQVSSISKTSAEPSTWNS